MLDPATLAQPAIRGSDLDRAQRLVQALGAITDLVDAAGDLHGVRPERLACLLASIAEPLEEELHALARRAEGAQVMSDAEAATPMEGVGEAAA